MPEPVLYSLHCLVYLYFSLMAIFSKEKIAMLVHNLQDAPASWLKTKKGCLSSEHSLSMSERVLIAVYLAAALLPCGCFQLTPLRILVWES